MPLPAVRQRGLHRDLGMRIGAHTVPDVDDDQILFQQQHVAVVQVADVEHELGALAPRGHGAALAH